MALGGGIAAGAARGGEGEGGGEGEWGSGRVGEWGSGRFWGWVGLISLSTACGADSSFG